MSVNKQTSERIHNRLNNVICKEIQDIINKVGTDFKPEVKINFEKISEYIKNVSGDLYKDGSLKNFYSGEVSPNEIPKNTLVMVRYTGNCNSDVYFLNTREVTYMSGYSDIKEIAKTMKMEDRNYNLSRYKQYPDSPKYLGYSDGVLFHFLGGTVIQDCMNSGIWKESAILEKEYLTSYLERDKRNFIVESVTSKERTWDGFKNTKYTLVCRDAGCIPLEKLDSWCSGIKLEDPKFKPYKSFVEKFANDEGVNK